MKIVWSSDVVLSSVNNGVYFTTKQVSQKPKIINVNSVINNDKKLLMMYDPDATKPFIHWVTTLSGKDILPYYPPSPPEKTGLHRYMFCLISSPPSTNNRILNKIPSCKPILYFTSKYMSKFFTNGGTKKRYNLKCRINNRKSKRCL
jgi:hypothetical protein